MNDITGSINTTTPMITAEIHAKSHANLAHIHLNSARIFTDLALAIDNDQHYKNSAPQDVINSYMSYVSSTVICSVAALEAMINQFVVDNSEKLNASSHNNNDQLFRKYEKLNKNKNLLEQLFVIPTVMLKFNVVSFLIKGHFILHNQIKENAIYLIDLRNSLVHFTPEWNNVFKRYKKLENSRKNRFTDSPFFSQENDFFPYRCLGASCAAWGLKAASSFINMFKSNIG